MDFHTMVSNFKKQVLEEKKQISELTSASRKLVRKYIADGTPGRHTPRYSFNDIFGDETTMRAIFPIGSDVQTEGTNLFKRIVDQGWEPAFTFRTVDQKMRMLGGGQEYTVPMEVPVLDMKKEEVKVIPKGPRAGEEITRTQKVSLGKLVQKFGTEADKAWWKENQNSLREMENVRKYFLKPWINGFAGTTETKLHIVVSRHPIDVARMSDFGLTRSCHSEGSSHFNCAINESKGHGMVAYLVKGSDVDEYDLINNINAEEIFGDHDVGVDGPEPVGRVRIYKLYNADTGEDFGVVENRVYGVKVPDFLPTVRKWMREKQKNVWADEEGNLKSDILDPGDWIRIGGEYVDQVESGGSIGDLISALFEDTPFEKQAYEDYEGVTYAHEDYFDENRLGVEAQMDRAAERIEDIIEAFNANKESVATSVYGDVEEGWDVEIPFYVQGGASVIFIYSYDDEFADKEGRTHVPGNGSSWQAVRDFAKIIETAMYNSNIYTSGESRIEAYDDENENKLSIEVMVDFQFERPGMDAVDEFDQHVDDFARDFDSGYNKIYAIIRQVLIEDGYLPPGSFEKAVERYTTEDFGGFKNLKVLYDESDPGDGIDIKPDIPADKLLIKPQTPGHYKVAEFPKNNASLLLSRHLSLNQDAVNAQIRIAFKKLANEAFIYANKQMALPFAKEYQPKPKNMRQMMPLSFETRLEAFPSSMGEKALMVGLMFQLKLSPKTPEDDFLRAGAFLEFLDEHIDVLYQAAADTAKDLYELAEEKSREAAAARQKRADREGWTPGMRIPLDESMIKTALRKVLKKKLLQEQTGFETRLFQVILKLQIDPKAGGGIEQKLNRIRAIQGVTVVGHEESQRSYGSRVIEAKIKFHPESDISRPSTYVSQILVPEINSSKLVPGVKVIDIVKGSLKRIDK